VLENIKVQENDMGGIGQCPNCGRFLKPDPKTFKRHCLCGFGSDPPDFNKIKAQERQDNLQEEYEKRFGDKPSE
jgi:hypothetical protein